MNCSIYIWNITNIFNISMNISMIDLAKHFQSLCLIYKHNILKQNCTETRKTFNTHFAFRGCLAELRHVRCMAHNLRGMCNPQAVENVKNLYLWRDVDGWCGRMRLRVLACVIFWLRTTRVRIKMHAIVADNSACVQNAAATENCASSDATQVDAADRKVRRYLSAATPSAECGACVCFRPPPTITFHSQCGPRFIYSAERHIFSTWHTIYATCRSLTKIASR